jgi:hypothetical protein
VQSTAVLLAVAGFVLAMVKFDVPWSNMTTAGGLTPHRAYDAHRVLGVIAVGLCVLQVRWRGRRWLKQRALSTAAARVLPLC